MSSNQVSSREDRISDLDIDVLRSDMHLPLYAVSSTKVVEILGAEPLGPLEQQTPKPTPYEEAMRTVQKYKSGILCRANDCKPGFVRAQKVFLRRADPPMPPSNLHSASKRPGRSRLSSLLMQLGNRLRCTTSSRKFFLLGSLLALRRLYIAWLPARRKSDVSQTPERP